MKKIFFILYIVFLFASCKQDVDKKLKQNNDPIVETCSITVTQPQNGKITVKNKATDTELDAEALKKVAKDTQVSISLEANEGYKAVSLTIDGTTYNESSKDVTVTKNFAVSGVVEKLPTQPETYSITVTQPEGGKITVKNKATNTELDAEALKKVAKDTEVIITLKPIGGSKLKALIVDGVRNTIVIMKEITQQVKITKNIEVITNSIPLVLKFITSPNTAPIVAPDTQKV